MTAPRFYSWDDDGSPGRALSGNLQNRLKQILVACLVNGYGSKPGAGWTLEHEHANGFTLSNGDAYVNFVSNLAASPPYPSQHSGVVHIYVAESLTDTSKAVIAGMNLCSGPYRAEYSESSGFVRHSLHCADSLVSQLSTLQWTIIADSKTAIISWSGDGFSQGTLNATYYHGSLYLGDTININSLSNTFVALGGANANYNSYSYPFTLRGGSTAPRNLSTGLALYASTYAEPFNGRLRVLPTDNQSYNIPGLLPSFLNLQSPRLVSDGGFVGRLKGVIYDDVLSLYGWPAYLRALGFSGSDFTDRGKVVDIGGYSYAYGVGFNGGFLMTNDPYFW